VEQRSVLGNRAGAGRNSPSILPARAVDEVLVRTQFSAISRSTELLVFTGRVLADQWHPMRAPFQDGNYPGPIEHGYLNDGVVQADPPELNGRTAFCLYPHQTAYLVAAAAVPAVPDGVPA
jgi:hypothetical protein